MQLFALTKYLQSVAPDFGNRRHRLEHCLRMPAAVDGTTEKTTAGGCYPSFIYLFQRGQVPATVEKEVFPWLYRTGTLVKNGLTVGGRFGFPDCPQQSDYGYLRRGDPINVLRAGVKFCRKT